MMASDLILGSVHFGSFEIPERITFGGKQKLVVHALPGGGRVVDAMGADDAPVRWSGIFSGANAASRVRMLERMRRGGSRYLLSWDAWLFSVVIQEFEADAARAWWIPYRIELCVIPDLGAIAVDWLAAATLPAVAVSSLSGDALTSTLVQAGAGLAATELTAVSEAAGTLAQYTTAAIFSGVVP